MANILEKLFFAERDSGECPIRPSAAGAAVCSTNDSTAELRSRSGVPARPGETGVRGPIHLLLGILLLLVSLCLGVNAAEAAITQVQKINSSVNNNTTITATYPSTPTAGNLLIAIATNRIGVGTPPTTPGGWSVAIDKSNLGPGILVYYKIAGAAEPTGVTVATYSMSGPLGLQLFEYSGMDASSPLDITNFGTGSDATQEAALLSSTAVGPSLVIAAAANLTNAVTFNTWSNSFIEEYDFIAGTGGNRTTFGSGTYIAASIGTYSTVVTASAAGSWSTTIVAFKGADSCPGDVVTTTADSGAGSLRECITKANGNPGLTIGFNIPNTDPNYTNGGSGSDYWWAIKPGATALPQISANGTTIDGTTQTTNRGNTNTRGPEIEINGTLAGNTNGLYVTSANNTIRGLAITGYTNTNMSGIVISGASAANNTIAGNYIGTNSFGSAASPNERGITITSGADGNIIGGATAADRNIISGNELSGVVILSAGTTSNVVKGNYIGTDAAGSSAIANVSGVLIAAGATGNTIGGTGSGEGNLIAYNSGDGIYTYDSTTDNNVFSGNSIYSNGDIGIDIGPTGTGTGSGANNDKARPTITGISFSGANFTIAATVTSGDTIEFFRVNNTSSPAVSPDAGGGEGYLFLGSCVDNGSCSGPHISAVADANGAGGTVQATLLSSGLASGDYVTSTARDGTNGTSEFSANFQTPLACTVTNTNDSGAGSLRECINYANITPGMPISFNIATPPNQSSGGDSWWRISPVSVLPTITAASTSIDGTTQTTNMGNTNSLGPEIEIYGAGAGAGADGLTINNVGSVTIKGLTINGFTRYGIYITGAGATGSIIRGNYLGTTAQGDAASANSNGIYVDANASNIDIGGSNAGEGNLISGNTSYGIGLMASSTIRIYGNKLGTDRSATAKIPNQIGIYVNGANTVTVGGSTAGQGNIISGNTFNGINVMTTSTGVTVRGNTVGSGATGTESAIGNSFYGILLDASSVSPNIMIGGSLPGEGNLFAYNSSHGIGAFFSRSGGFTAIGNVIRDNAQNGIFTNWDNAVISKNLIYRNGTGATKYDGIFVHANADAAKILNNTVHGNGLAGIAVAGTNATVRNNIVTGNLTSYGLNLTGTLSESYNLVTDASTTPANALGRSNVALDATDLNANPLYVNAAGNDFTLQNASPAINRGIDLAADQPDMNGAAAGNFNGYAPDMGYWESAVTTTCPVSSTADSGTGTLRACITYANTVPGTTIGFSISATDSGYQTSGADHWWQIAPTSALPTITAAGTIVDGATQTTLLGNANSLGPEIELNGTGAGAGIDGLTLTGGNSTVRGLVINSFTNNGIKLDVNDTNTIVGNYIGTDATGIADLGNTGNGVYIYWHSGANIIGTSAAADRNVISGNNGAGIFTHWSDGNVIKNNYFGTNALGTAAIGNATSGLDIYSAEGAGGNIIGGSGANEGNLISGNTQEGIYLDTGPVNVTIKGNLIGTQANGTVAMANGWNGIFGGGTGHQIGGTAAGEGNVISGNTRSGIYFQGSSSSIQGNFIGTDASATVTMGNLNYGVRLDGGASNNTIGGTADGAGNVIANSGWHGVAIQANTTTGNSILGNAIYASGILGIDLSYDGIPTPNDANDADTGSNNLQNFPVLSSALTNGTNSVTISGTLNSIASTNFRIEFFASTVADASGYGEAQRYLGFASVTTDGSNNASFSQNLVKAVAVGEFITATATNLTTNDTSEFALNATATAMVTISGTVYTDEGVTNIGAGKTVRLVVGGVSAGTAVTAAGGTYSIDSGVALPANTPFLVYVDDDAKKGTTVSASTGSNLSGINIYTGNSDATGDGYVIVRHDNAGSMTSALMSTALGAYSDTDIKYTVPAGVLTASTYNYLYVPAGHTFAPGANTSLDSVKILGAFTGGASTHTVTGHWNAATGTYTANTSTVSFLTRASTMNFTPGASSYYNIVMDTNDRQFALLGNVTATNDVTYKSGGTGFGTFSIGTRTISTKNFIWQSGYILQAAGSVIECSSDFTKTGGGYALGNGAGLTFRFIGSGNSTFTPGAGTHGSIAVSKDTQSAVVTLSTNNLLMTSAQSLNINTGIFDLAGKNLDIGGGSTFSNTGTLRLQGSENLFAMANDVDSGTVEYNGSGNYASLAADAVYYHLVFNGTGSWTLNNIVIAAGNFTITSGTLNAAGYQIEVIGNWSNSGTFNHGNGEVLFSGTGQSLSGNTPFYTLTKSVASADTLTFAAGSTTTVSGTATLNGASGQLLSLVSSSPGTYWNFNLGAASTKAISYVSVTDSDASGSDATKKPVLPTNSTDGGHNVSWFAVGYSLSGKVFEDANFAGTAADWDSGVSDKALANVDVELYDNSNVYITSVISDGSGNFTFTGLANGTYKVRVRTATIGDADTTPLGGLNGTVPATWPYPLPEMSWGNGAAMYGGVSATVDDTATGDNAGIGDNYVTLTVSGANVSNVNFGFAYNLIVNVDDDGNANNTRSKQGSLRQFIKNANAIGSAGSTTANSSQFRMQVATNQSSGADAWWRFTVITNNLPAIADGGTTLDGSTQRTNSGVNSNTLGPEIEVFGNNARSVGLDISAGSNHTIQELVVNSFTSAGIAGGGATVAQVRLYGNYVGTNAIGSAAMANGSSGVYFWNGNQSDIDIGGSSAGQGNLISGNTQYGISLAGGNTYRIYGNKIGVDRSGTAALANGNAGVDMQGTTASVSIGGSGAGEGNILSKNGAYGVAVRGTANVITIKGNTIGSGVTGSETTLGNGMAGIWVVTTHATPNLVIGGLASGEGNLIAYSTQEGIKSDTNYTTGYQILGNIIRNNTREGINNGWDNVIISANAIYSNGTGGTKYDGINLLATADANKLYHNTIHGNGKNGILVAGTNAIIKNNAITGNGSAAAQYGLNVTGSVSSEAYNLITDASTTPANFAGQSNIALTATDLNANPLYTNAAGGVFTLTECSSPAINSGVDLVADQPDMNGASGGNFNGYAPDIGAYEAASCSLSLAGTVYTDEGVTNIGAGKTVRVLVNGLNRGTATTIAGGTYSITTTYSANDALLVYIDGDDGATTDATTVTVTPSGNLSGINLYVDHLITRHDNTGALTNALMSTAKGAYSDTEILYSVSGGNLAVSGATTELYVPAAHTFTPGGNVSTMDAEVIGTLNGGANTFTVDGNWNSSGGTVVYGTSTLNMTGVGKTFQTKTAERPWNLTIGDGVSATSVTHSPPNWENFVNNDLVLANNATLTLSGMYYYMPKTGDITIGTGATLNISGGVMTRNINDSSSHISTTGTISGTGTFEVVIEAGSTNAPVTARTYDVDLSVSGAVNAVGVLGGGASLNLGAKSLRLYDVNSNNDFYGILDNPGNIPVTAAELYVANPSGSGNAPFFSGKLICRGATYTFTNVTVYSSNTAVPSIDCLTGGASSTWNVSGNVTIDGSRPFAGLISAGASTWNVGGNWSNSGTFTAGTSTVVLNGTNQSITGNTTFNNLTKSVATARTLTFAASSTTTVNGIATLNGASGQLLSLVSSAPGTYWNFNLGAASTKAISYVSVTDSDASGSDASKKPVMPGNSTDGGHNVSWFGSATITVTKLSTVISDPFNGATNPKRIPGAVIEYSIAPANSGTGSPDANTVSVTDIVDSASLAFYVTGGVTFTDGATSSALALGAVAYSDTAAPGPYVYTYTPVPDGDGYDGNITSIQANTTGTFAFGGAPAPSFTIKYRVKVK